MRNLKLKLLLVVLALVVSLVPLSGVLAATTAVVTITATPEYLTITNTENTWAIGAVAESATVWWSNDAGAPDEPAVDGDGKSIATNGSSIAANITIHAHDFTGGVGWAIETTTGADQVILGFFKTGDANKAAMGKLVDPTPQELAHNLTATTGHIHWGMYLDTGTFTDGAEKTGTVTLTVEKHT